MNFKRIPTLRSQNYVDRFKTLWIHATAWKIDKMLQAFEFSLPQVACYIKVTRLIVDYNP